MSFHLNEGRLFIRLATYLGQVLHRRDTFLCILKLGSNPECGTPDQLVVFDVDNTAGDIAIDDVEGEVQCFWTETERKMNLNEEID